MSTSTCTKCKNEIYLENNRVWVGKDGKVICPEGGMHQSPKE